MNKTPATEENLTISENKIKDDDNIRDYMLPVIVDGIRGTACIHKLGTFSLRLGVILSKPHDELGTEFQTKYFKFLEPGKIAWGHGGSTFEIDLVLSE